MSELSKNYDEKQMTWNEHDRIFHEQTVDTIYERVAEVVITQNERFFKEQEAQKTRICACEMEIERHDKRLRRLEAKELRKVAVWSGTILIVLTLLSFIIF